MVLDSAAVLDIEGARRSAGDMVNGAAALVDEDCASDSAGAIVKGGVVEVAASTGSQMSRSSPAARRAQLTWNAFGHFPRAHCIGAPCARVRGVVQS